MTTSKPSLFHRLVGLVTNLFTPEPPPPRQDVDAMMGRLTAQYDRTVDQLVAGMTDGRITIGQFVGSMPSLIKEHQLAAALVASGGTDSANPQVYAIAQRNVDAQLAYFERWKAELLAQAAAGALPTPEYIANRAKLYGKAATTTAAQATIEAQGLPAMPFYPGQGTQCHTNCNCGWDIKTLDVVNGNYDCFWAVHAGESCPTCLARGRVANPLRVRRGEIVNPERYKVAQLYA